MVALSFSSSPPPPSPHPVFSLERPQFGVCVFDFSFLCLRPRVWLIVRVLLRKKTSEKTSETPKRKGAAASLEEKRKYARVLQDFFSFFPSSLPPSYVFDRRCCALFYRTFPFCSFKNRFFSLSSLLSDNAAHPWWIVSHFNLLTTSSDCQKCLCEGIRFSAFARSSCVRFRCSWPARCAPLWPASFLEIISIFFFRILFSFCSGSKLLVCGAIFWHCFAFGLIPAIVTDGPPSHVVAPEFQQPGGEGFTFC